MFRGHLAKVDLATGALNPLWNPNADRAVYAIAANSSGSLFIGGAFFTVGGVARNGLAKISASGTGALDLSWQANTNAFETVQALLVASDQRLYVGGEFSIIGGSLRRGLAKVSTTSPAIVDAWNPGASAVVYALSEGNHGEIFAGGEFIFSGGAYRTRAVKLSPITGLADPGWNPSLFAPVRAQLLDPTAQTIAFGGAFESLGGFTAPSYAVIGTASIVDERIFCDGFELVACGP